eukprot:scaffold302743_cov17-Tisochrysis_lutea.AAC.1
MQKVLAYLLGGPLADLDWKDNAKCVRLPARRTPGELARTAEPSTMTKVMGAVWGTVLLCT